MIEQIFRIQNSINEYVIFHICLYYFCWNLISPRDLYVLNFPVAIPTSRMGPGASA
jgi:hypothetical protein